MNRRLTFFTTLLILATATGVASARIRNVTDPDAPRSVPVQGTVSVRWNDPAQFTEIKYSHNRWEARRGNWVEQLAIYLRDRAQKRLPAGERLDVDILDVQRAGNYEPWRGIAFNDVRVIRDIYPPRITLSFKRIGANGQVIAQGERKLSDMGFLTGSTTVWNSDPLRYEKTMIDRWLVRELAASGA
ncbi:DUF3016 domain-containing protein [Lysobacter sp. CFH 32150]|uniref:DUF3016 domain-containing protein n=1 Tax=Lysobacter sp. CFH 32150 TaxID=2927128 RepID=UPI001FA77152|nr:DUF3016 domain-containing protein [Lysobacter sp. CFH 32150]MCI4568456.1 DUF3016 domain-containing protein [Lysobacter sp. CFH 32150]